MLYFLIISITMFICVLMAVIASLSGAMPLWYAITAPFLVNFYAITVLGIVCLIMRLLPKSLWNYKRKRFYVSKKEVEFYDKVLHIKKWKEKVPEKGSIAGFPKDKIRSLEEPYLAKFLQENCFAESMHFIGGLMGFTVLLFLKKSNYFFAIPILIVNFILNIMPSIIQRFNRYRLAKIYENVKVRNASQLQEQEQFEDDESLKAY